MGPLLRAWASREEQGADTSAKVRSRSGGFPLTGMIHDVTGTYTPAWVVAGVALVSIPPPTKHHG